MNSYYDTGAAVFALVFGLIAFIGAIAGYVIASFFLMKIFEKAGVQGKWRAWVPVYNMMVLAKLADLSPWVVLIAIALNIIPVLNYITWIVTLAVVVMIFWRVGLKLQKDAVWVLFLLIPGVGALIWLGINAFDKSRWNPNIAPAPWAAQNFLADSTVWDGVPQQPTAAAAPPQAGYGAPQGYQAPPQGYQPPAYPTQPPAAPTPPASAPVPPAAPTPPPAAPTTPPAPPAPPAAPSQPDAPNTPPADPNQPPA